MKRKDFHPPKAWFCTPKTRGFDGFSWQDKGGFRATGEPLGVFDSKLFSKRYVADLYSRARALEFRPPLQMEASGRLFLQECGARELGVFALSRALRILRYLIF